MTFAPRTRPASETSIVADRERDAAARAPQPQGAPIQARWSDARRDANARAVGALQAEVAGAAPVQRREQADGPVADDAAPQAAATSDAGAPLPDATRAEMERAFQADFSSVRIHQGEQAPQVGALAYTQGEHVYFAPGQFAPGTTAGKELLGHELTHVIQQRGGRVAATTQAKGVAINDDRGLEAEADALGARAARGEVVDVPSGGETTAGAVQRKGEGDADTDEQQVASDQQQAPASEARPAPTEKRKPESLEDAIAALSDASRKHIMAGKHAWHLVIDDYTAPAGEKATDEIPEGMWDKVAALLVRVAAGGAESRYKSVTQKQLEINGQVVTLTYKKIPQARGSDASFYFVSDGWVQTR